ncbi:MAG: hypothetical protein WDM78_18575 [Puia sp.]
MESISPEVFRRNYYTALKPLVIAGMAKKVARHIINGIGIFFKAVIGDQQIGIYNNSKSDAYTPVNTADDYMRFGDYIDMIRKGPAEWRIFLFNIFEHAPIYFGGFLLAGTIQQGVRKKISHVIYRGAGISDAYAF